MRNYRLIFCVDDIQEEQTISKILYSDKLAVSDEDIAEMNKEKFHTESQINNEALAYLTQKLVMTINNSKKNESNQ